jgi:hypothetical protein
MTSFIAQLKFLPIYMYSAIMNYILLNSDFQNNSQI